MDATTLTLLAAGIGVGGGVIGTVVGVMVAEVLARRREAVVEERALRREYEDRVRTHLLQSIDDTRRELGAGLGRAMAVAAGDTSASAIPVGPHAYPRTNAFLVYDLEVFGTYATISSQLLMRRPGAGVTAEDLERVAAAQLAVQRILAEQERRALADEPLLEPDPTVIASRPELWQAYATMTGRSPFSKG